MYCPDCGVKTSADLKFCRSCGLGLEKIAQSLVEQLPTQFDRLEARKNNLERLGRIARNLFMLGSLGLCLFLIGYLLTQGNFKAALGVFGSVALISCALLSMFMFEKAQELKKASMTRQIQNPEGSTQNATTGKLLSEEHHEPPPSVTERPTELLFVEKKGGDQVS